MKILPILHICENHAHHNKVWVNANSIPSFTYSPKIEGSGSHLTYFHSCHVVFQPFLKPNHVPDIACTEHRSSSGASSMGRRITQFCNSWYVSYLVAQTVSRLVGRLFTVKVKAKNPVFINRWCILSHLTYLPMFRFSMCYLMLVV